MATFRTKLVRAVAASGDETALNRINVAVRASPSGRSARPLHIAYTLIALAWLVVITYLLCQASLNAWTSDAAFQLPANQLVVAVIVGSAIAGLVFQVIPWSRARIGYLLVVLALALGVAIRLIESLERAQAFAAAVWILMVAALLGDLLIGILFRRAAGPVGLDRLLFSLVVGLGCLGHLMLGWALIGGLDARLAAGGLALLTLARLPRLIEVAKSIPMRILNSLRVISGSPAINLYLPILSMTLGWLVLSLIAGIAPEVQFDSLMYHLGIPKVIIDAHRFVVTPYSVQSWFYLGTEMNFLLGMLLAGQTAAKLINLSLYVTTVLAIFCFGRAAGSSRAGLLGAALYASAPLVAWEASTAYIDVAESSFCCLAVLAVYRWLVVRQTSWLALAGLLTGFAISTKTNAAFLLVPLTFLALAVASTNPKQTIINRLGPSVVYAFTAGLTGLEWPILRFAETKNPVFPMFNAVFSSPYWAPVNETFDFGNFGTGKGFISLLQLPWALTFTPRSFGEGPYLVGLGMGLVLLPLGIYFVSRDRTTAFLLGLILAFGFAWSFSVQLARYLLPCLPLIDVVAGLVLARLAESWKGARTFRLVSFLASAIVLVWMASTVPLYVVRFWNIPERIPVGVAFGMETPEHYLSRTLPEYDALQAIAKHEDSASHIVEMSTQDEDRLYAPGVLEGLYAPTLAPLFQANDPATTTALLRSMGITDILINRVGFQTSRANGLFASDAFLDTQAVLLFAHRNVEAYHLTLDSVQAPPNDIDHYPNLLENGGFESTSGDGLAGWASNGSPLVDRTDRFSRSGQTAVEVTSQDGLTQAVRVLPGQVYRLGAYAKAAAPGSSVRTQVNWLDDQEHYLGSGLNVYSVIDQWQHVELVDTAPPRAARAIVYANAQAGQVWVDDYSFEPRSYNPLLASLALAQIVPPAGDVPPLGVQQVSLNGEPHTALLAHPTTHVTLNNVWVSTGERLAVSTGIHPACTQISAGAEFVIDVLDGSARTTVLDRVMQPKAVPGDRFWVDATVDLSRWEHRSISLQFTTVPNGGDFTCAWALWGDPILTSASIGNSSQ